MSDKEKIEEENLESADDFLDIKESKAKPIIITIIVLLILGGLIGVGLWQKDTIIDFYKKITTREELKGNVQVYYNKSTGTAYLKKPSKKSNIEVYSLEIEEGFKNLSLLDAETSDYLYYVLDNRLYLVDFKTGEEVLEDKDLALIRNNDKYDTRYIGISTKDNSIYLWGIYDILKKETVIEPQYIISDLHFANKEQEIDNYIIQSLNNHTLITYQLTEENENTKYGVIDYTNGDTIIPFEYINIYNSEDYIVVEDNNNQLFIFDTTGKEYLSKKYNKIYDMVKGKYILVQDNKNVKMVDINGIELYDFGKYTFKELNDSNYQEEEIIFEFIDPDNKDACMNLHYYEKSETGKITKSSCTSTTTE